MERAEIERFKRRLESLEPTAENLKRVAAARGNPVDPRMLNEEVRGMTARFLLVETDSPEDPGYGERLIIFFEAGNFDIPLELAAETARRLAGRPSICSTPGRYGGELLDAVEKGNSREVARLLSSGADPNARNNIGVTALAYAIKHHPEAIGPLLAAGANPNASEYGGWTMLMCAIKYHPEVVGPLLAAGADPNRSTFEGWTALMFAVDKHPEHPEVAELLLAAGADPNARSGNGQVTALTLANEKNVETFVKLILKLGKVADVDESFLRTIDEFPKVALVLLCSPDIALNETVSAKVVRKLENKAVAAVRGLLSDEKLLAAVDFGRFLEETLMCGTGEIELNAPATRNLVYGMTRLLEESPERLDNVLMALRRRFANSLEKHAEDPQVASSINAFAACLACLTALSEEMCDHELVL